ncbi:hypothetical protein [Amycolatopsis nalaikhensis]|uniref:Uncharacterized protein n=1 Tax=Amycolatopsis nalaikhensis TaxID=715472 RepID=A0ABY8XUI9_9PSEU|nr:hypothetical protein [Amycolatopsis sp. 2-2]WIV59355.1 hypothetical protein QP939_12405 [Amycolatopsis sp. 2-2]
MKPDGVVVPEGTNPDPVVEPGPENCGVPVVPGTKLFVPPGVLTEPGPGMVTLEGLLMPLFSPVPLWSPEPPRC